MKKNLLFEFGKSSVDRVEKALRALRSGNGVLVMDDKSRENEGDMIFSAENMTLEQMALAIRHGSGIVCLALTKKRCEQLELPLMVQCNTSRYQTAFTITIEAAIGVSTGVSASDRLRTIRVSIQDHVQPHDLNRPGHVFPLCAQEGGVLVRLGHTEAAVDLMSLAGLKPYGVLCEVVNEDGSMARLLDIITFSYKNSMPVLTVRDLVAYRLFHSI